MKIFLNDGLDFVKFFIFLELTVQKYCLVLNNMCIVIFLGRSNVLDDQVPRTPSMLFYNKIAQYYINVFFSELI